MKKLYQIKHGFSLIELAIVITILAFIIVSIVAGRQIIISTKINKLTTKIVDLERANLFFNATYDAIPGDFSKASSYFTAINTLNGDGNDRVETSTYESTNALIQLAAANLINDQLWDYQTIYEALTFDVFRDGGATIMHQLDNSGNLRTGFDYSNETTNYIKFGAGVEFDDEILTPRELYQIDSKIDNGLPLSGEIVVKVSNAASSNCYNASSEYNTLITEISCLFIKQMETQ